MLTFNIFYHVGWGFAAMSITKNFLYLSVILAGVSALSVPSAQAGFDFVTPTVSKTAPVDDVETSILPPQTGVPTGEVGTVPSVNVAPASVAPHRPAPIISYPDEKPVAPMMAPTPIAEPVVVPPAVTPQTATTTIRRVPPPVRTPAAPEPVTTSAPQSSGEMVTQPGAVYPPRGNVPARPLGASGSVGAVAPMRAAPVVSVPDEPLVVNAAPVLPDAVPTPVSQPTVAVTTKPTAVPVMPATVSSAPRSVVDGFGTNVPLSLALQQIIPAGLTLEDQVGLDQNMMVSWAGGRPFDKILEDMLYANGVRVTVTGNSVVLFRATGAGVVSAAPIAPVTPVAPTVPVVAMPAAIAAPVSTPAPLPERVVADVSVVPAAPAGTGPAVAPVSDHVQVVPQNMSDQRFDASAIDLFSGRTNEPVQTVLSRWGRMAHVTVEWNVGGDLILPQSFAVNATFPRAVERLLNMYRDDPARPIATLETDPASGAAVLRVTRAATTR